MALRDFYGNSMLTVEEFLELERESTVRHEYVGGELHAFAGATEAHNLIATNMITALAIAARGTPCRVYPSDMMLRAANDVFYYPDVMVVCDPQDTGSTYKTQPSTIVEILSPSTAGTDLREKALVYKNISSMTTYVVVHQTERRVKTYRRNDAGVWEDFEVMRTGTVHIRQPQLTLTLDEIYENVPLIGGR